MDDPGVILDEVFVRELSFSILYPAPTRYFPAITRLEMERQWYTG